MQDVNGVKLHTGDVVRISGSYRGNSDGLYFIAESPGDVTWSGNAYCLLKMFANGRLSLRDDNTAFWPLYTYLASHKDQQYIDYYNSQCAKIEVVKIPNMENVIDYFKRMKQDCWQDKIYAEHYASVIRYIRKERKRT